MSWDDRRPGSDRIADKSRENIMFSHIHKKALDEINFERVANELMMQRDTDGV